MTVSEEVDDFVEAFCKIKYDYVIVGDILLARLRNSNVPAFQFALIPAYSSWLMPEPKPEGVKDCLSIMNCVVAPFSRGSIHIQSSRPGYKPVIDPRYLEHWIERTL
ncbi:hypothetical protein V1515DRAFT_367055 [Lipomyces mesembrius]